MHTIVRGANEVSLLADGELRNTLVPTPDDLATKQHQRKSIFAPWELPTPDQFGIRREFHGLGKSRTWNRQGGCQRLLT